MVLEQSSSSTAIKNIVKVTAAAVQRLRAKVNAHRKDQEVRDGFSIEEICSTIIYCTKEQNLGSTAGTAAVLRYLAIFLVPWFLFPWFSLWLPGSRFFVFACGVAPNLRIL